ncbi:septation protein SepH [Citricoccus sp. GCM10030269]|uniref:septation protein SepH n=1 Tax=Citricoccus sp. GCM10030269 TaxID=3273388 RepID=UPI003609B023
MQELRLVGVREDGGHLLLSNEAGEEFSLPVTEALRAAATRPIGRPSARAADAAEGVVTPRDIQARIRAGATAEEVAAESGVDLDRVRKYEGPVLAERDWIARQARQVEVAAPSPGHDLYRSTFGEEPAVLGDMVRHRLTVLGMDPGSARWDAWRTDDGSWTVSLDFSTEGSDSTGSTIGDQPPALWTYRQSSRHLTNQNRWAQVLSELDPLDGPFGGRRLSAVGDRPFNVEEAEDEDPNAASTPRSPRPAAEQDAQDELLDVLHARRGQRLGVDEEGDDELALMLTRDEQATPTANRPHLTVASDPGADGVDDGTEDRSEDRGEDSAEDRADHGGDDSGAEPDGDGVDADDDADADRRGDARTVVHPDQTTLDFGVDGAEESNTDAEAGESGGRGDSSDRSPSSGKSTGDKGRAGTPGRKTPPRSSAAKPKRPSVPSWDEIVFGRKND